MARTPAELTLPPQPPLVSVLLPCFNAERFLSPAVESLLGQTHRQLEIVAIDDGSADGTAAILDGHAERDPRVRVVRNAANQGLIATLNFAVAEATGEFIARMDADDVAHRTRIERQLEVLRSRSDVDVLGTGSRLVSEAGHQRVRPGPVRCAEPAGARFMALLGTPLAHPTLLARTEVMRRHPYGGSEASLHTEDYELFTRMLSAGVGLGNLDEALMTIRVHRSGVSQSFEEIQIRNFVLCARRYLMRTLGLEPEDAPHRVLVNRLDATITDEALHEGFRLLDLVEREFLEREEPRFGPEIRRIADMQRVDIVLQASLKGSPSVRAAALRLGLRYANRLLSPAGRRYLVSKLYQSSTVDRNT